MDKTLRVLNVEDRERDAALLSRHLARAGYEIVSDRVETADGMRAALAAREWDVILCDYSLPQFNALAALSVLKETGFDIPFIIISGTIGEDVAVEAMRAGAHDYLMKDNLLRLAPTIERELHEAENRRRARRAEEALRESEDRYRDLVEHSHDLICTHDLGGQILSVNQAAIKLLGYDEATLLTKNIRDILFPQDRDQFDDYVSRLVKDGIAQGEMDAQTSTGDRRIWEYTNTLRTEGVAAPIVRGVAHDVTDQKSAEAELRRSEAQYRRLLDTTYEGVLIFDDEMRITYANQRLAEMLRASTQELIGNSAQDFVADTSRADVERRWMKRADGTKEQYDLRLRRKDGSDLWVIVCATPFYGEGREFAGSLSMMTDITERKRAEEALKQSESRFRALFENALDAVLITDDRGVYVDANPAASKLLGLPTEEIIGSNVADFIEDGYRGEMERMWAEFQARGSQTGVFQILRPDGKRVEADFSARANFVPGLHLSVLRDITERRELEDRFRQSQKMEAVGQLAGGIAHDFNNLLTAINGYSDLALRRADNDMLRGHLGEIRTAGERATSLTRQLLAFSRKQILQPKVLSLNDVIAATIKMLHRLIGENIDITTALSATLGQVKVDPGQIEQVLLNLVVNARDAMPEGGRVTIKTENVHVGEDIARQEDFVQPGPHVRLTVSDTGCGIDAETQKHIFDPFFTTKEVGKGTGLGLSTVYGIVKQSEGHISVASEVGRGTTFEIYLPRFDKAHGAEESADEDIIPRGDETVLLVEDEEIVRTLTRTLLEEAGYNVIEAANGTTALEICSEFREQIHLVLTDVIMPGVSGRQLVERIKSMRPETRALYMSGYTDDAIVHHGVLEEGTPFLQKPFSTDDLARKVREVLDRKPPAR